MDARVPAVAEQLRLQQRALTETQAETRAVTMLEKCAGGDVEGWGARLTVGLRAMLMGVEELRRDVVAQRVAPLLLPADLREMWFFDEDTPDSWPD